MGNGLWFITILKPQPWIGVMLGLLIFSLLLWFKKWLAERLLTDQESD